ncbi:MAG: GTP-binding protein [Promethearchaeota archaeon]
MSSRQELFNELFEDFLLKNSEIEAIIVSDKDGLVIAGDKREDIDMELVGVLTSVVNPVLEIIRNEFSFRKFGTAAFDTENYRLLFVSILEENTLSIVLNSMASVDRIAPYAYLLAEKCAQILTAKEGESIQVSIPTFEYGTEHTERLKHQIYELKLDSGGIYRFKFIIIGEHEVGKTSLVRRFVDKQFSEDYRTTIGLNILTHEIDFFGNEIKLTLWDVGAQKYFKRFRKTYYLGAQAAFIVFDLTRRDTYDNVRIWYSELEEFVGNIDLPIVLVGNKSDLTEKRVVSYQDGVAMANELSALGTSRISYIETSAKSGVNVEDAFSLITYHYIMKSKDYEESELLKKLYSEIKSILDLKDQLKITFITENSYWSPGLQILTDINQLGKGTKIVDETDKLILSYENNLILENYIYKNFEIKNSDAVFCIFDARTTEKIKQEWIDIINKILENLTENSVLLIGIRVSEKTDYLKILEEFKIKEDLEKKIDSLIFFKMEEEYRQEVYDQLMTMLKSLDKIAWMKHVA